MTQQMTRDDSWEATALPTEQLPTLVLLINDTPVKTITDSDYTSGQIALFVEHATTSNGVKASFSSVAVYPAPDQLPS